MFLIRQQDDIHITIAVPIAHVTALVVNGRTITVKTVDGLDYSFTTVDDGLFDRWYEMLEQFWQKAEVK